SRHRKELQMSAGHASTIADKMNSLNNPLEYLRTLVELLKQPQDLISLHENIVRINRMGIKVASSSGEAGDEIHLQDIELGEGHAHLLMLTEIPWDILGLGTK
ncbi:MAG: hypothetical protein P8Z39_05035, partial [Gammaproteobacteria bacterium]